jgi:hypothetical protein
MCWKTVHGTREGVVTYLRLPIFSFVILPTKRGNWKREGKCDFPVSFLALLFAQIGVN